MTTALTSRPGSPPGPPQHWFLGNLPEFRRDRLGFLTECARTYGDCVALRFGPSRRLMLVSHPDLVEEVLVEKNKSFIKHFALRRTGRTLGNGLLTSEGEFWRKQRRLAQPAFQRDNFAGYAGVMVDYAEHLIETWADGETRDIQDEMMQLTLRIVARTLFGAELGAESARISAAMDTLLRAFTVRLGKFLKLPEWFPTPYNLHVEGAARRLDSLIYEFIAQRRAEAIPRDDLLSLLLHARDDEDHGARMSDRQLRDEMMTLFMAGHETTANTLAWAWFLLSAHPEVETKLHAELDDVLGDRAPTVADLPRLRYAEHIITETLRLYPTVWLLGREAIEPVKVGGYPVPIGMTVYMSQWVVHRDPRFFDDPESFRPERWRDGLAKRLHRYAYFPFGGGPRICIGNGFAQMEAVLLLATIARRFRLRLAPGETVRPLPTMTLRADGGMRMTIETR